MRLCCILKLWWVRHIVGRLCKLFVYEADIPDFLQSRKWREILRSAAATKALYLHFKASQPQQVLSLFGLYYQNGSRTNTDRNNVWSLLYKRIKPQLKREVNNEAFFLNNEPFFLNNKAFIKFIIISCYIEYLHFFWLKTRILHEILAYINVYICKVGMPSSLLSNPLFDPWIEQTTAAKWCGSLEPESQEGRKFDEICRVHTCICKESKKMEE